MTIQWHLTTHPDADLLQLTGHLGDDAIARFHGAIGWALARGTRTLLLDCTHLKGWSEAGRAAVEDAAQRLADQQRTLELIAPPHVVDGVPPALTFHPDLDTALDAHHQPATPSPTGTDATWRSTEWTDPAGAAEEPRA